MFGSSFRVLADTESESESESDPEEHATVDNIENITAPRLEAAPTREMLPPAVERDKQETVSEEYDNTTHTKVDKVKKIDTTHKVKKIDDNQYIIYGNETTVFTAEKMFVVNKSKVSVFWGRCFMCQCVGHSQRFCPLKYCPRCETWGHSIVTCVDKNSNLITRSTKPAAYRIHPSMTSKNWRTDDNIKRTTTRQTVIIPRNNDNATDSSYPHLVHRGEDIPKNAV